MLEHVYHSSEIVRLFEVDHSRFQARTRASFASAILASPFKKGAIKLESSSSTAEPQIPPPPPGSKSRTGKIALIVLILVVGAGIGAGVFWFGSSRANQPKVASPEGSATTSKAVSSDDEVDVNVDSQGESESEASDLNGALYELLNSVSESEALIYNYIYETETLIAGFFNVAAQLQDDTGSDPLDALSVAVDSIGYTLSGGVEQAERDLYANNVARAAIRSFVVSGKDAETLISLRNLYLDHMSAWEDFARLNSQAHSAWLRDWSNDYDGALPYSAHIEDYTAAAEIEITETWRDFCEALGAVNLVIEIDSVNARKIDQICD